MLTSRDQKITDELIVKQLSGSKAEDTILHFVMLEIEKEDLDPVAKNRALEDAGGDEIKSKALYLKYRILRLRDILKEIAVEFEVKTIENEKHKEASHREEIDKLNQKIEELELHKDLRNEELQNISHHLQDLKANKLSNVVSKYDSSPPNKSGKNFLSILMVVGAFGTAVLSTVMFLSASSKLKLLMQTNTELLTVFVENVDIFNENIAKLEPTLSGLSELNRLIKRIPLIENE